MSLGKLLAELVHGRLSVETPEGLFEDRIGMQIERVNAIRRSEIGDEEAKMKRLRKKMICSAAAEDNDASDKFYACRSK